MALLFSYADQPSAYSSAYSSPSPAEERLLAHLLRSAASTAAEPFKSLSGSHPFDVLLSKDAYELRADAPGLSEADITVEVHEGVLAIIAGSAAAQPKPAVKPAAPAAQAQQVQNAAPQPQWKVLRREREAGNKRWARAFLLPENVDSDAISVTLERGVLIIQVPLCPPPPKPAPRRIAVKSNPLAAKHSTELPQPAPSPPASEAQRSASPPASGTQRPASPKQGAEEVHQHS